VQGTDGSFYGTTFEGGGNNNGTVFSITAGGTLATLYNFCSQGGANCTDGANPAAGLVQGANGIFYGTTNAGGANGHGTVFSITAGGTLATLYNFYSQGGGSCTDGAYPAAGLVQGTNGIFYGTTYQGGAHNAGTVFSITAGGTLATLYNFCSQGGGSCTDGAYLAAGLIQGTNGIFYGTTYQGGAHNDGTVFSITTGGTLVTLHSFHGTHGQYPYAGGLVQGTNGKFYGTTYLGGTTDDGTVYSISVGLGPFVETNPTSGAVRKAVKILGTNLTGSTSVTFNGTAARFTVKSKTEITTSVPAGATTGPVQVVTPGGTLSSNVPFVVN
jgi:uncharacterized repeat protein (TIGR03803 family)